MNTTTGAERGRRFRPTLWSTVAAAAALAVLIGLGTWQVQRLHWKEGVIAYREARLAMPPVSVGGETAAADLAFRRASAIGRFLHAEEFLIANRVRGGRAGFEVVTPLRLGPADLILVNRGWIPLDRADPETRREGQVPGAATVTGVLREPGKTSRWVPDNDLPGVSGTMPIPGPWLPPPDLPACAMRSSSRMKRAIPAGIPSGARQGWRYPTGISNTRFTWYGLALVLVAIYVVYHWRREEAPDEPG